WYLGPDRTAPIDSSVVPASEVQESWGASDIASGTTQEARWAVTAGIPFGVVIEFRYHPSGGGSKRATVTFNCGPSVTPGTPPPAITSLSVRPPFSPAEPGDTLVVDYSVTAAGGLWLTAVVLSGPCESEQIFFDSLRTSVTRSARLPVPPGCALGRPIVATVFAIDAAGEETSKSINTQISLVDNTPPAVAVFFVPPGGLPSASLIGNFFVGDTIQVQLQASDNHAVRTLVWEVLPAGAHDSVLVSGTAATHNFSIPLDPSTVGSLQLRVSGRDSVGNVTVVLTEPNAIRVYPTIQRPTRTATINGDLQEIAFDIPRGVIYLLLSQQRRLTVVSSATLDVVRSVDLPSHPSDLDLSAGGDSLFVVLPQDRALAIYDLRTPAAAPTVLPLISVDTPTVQRPLNVRVASNGKAIITFRDVNARLQSVLEVDFATGQQRGRPEARGTNVVSDAQLTRSPDRSVIMLGNEAWFFQRYDAATDTFSPQRQPRRSGLLSLDRGGSITAIGTDIYDAAMQFVRTVETPGGGGSANTLLSVDGQFLYLPDWRLGIVRSRVSDGRLADRTPIPIRPNHIRVSPDGSMLVIIERQIIGSSRISTVDLR
ncbi:MAG TPA: hypothetical protein VJ650_16985, partial [Gemmatimonadaceae bacterium]|nr:hypothetical protein [Gemmatimonadaceae bacterium]